ncbi:TolC family protein [Echinicola sp. CAU 1574]|uniref:TolC family protein n=1 Tax=Echinicola arenosa TaxID=2774144 RepID=A0ABR9AEL3_9BACT|nr:TolC family protein [Echinicola arenosa]MBD8487199.1 TolC family protein [Echinicola arenosa]
MKKKLFTAMLLACGIFTSVWAQNEDISSLSLEECVQIGIENNLELQRSVLNQETNRANLMESKSQRYPSLSASSSYRYNWGRSINPYTNVVTTSSFGNANFGANANMTLFAGRQISNSINQAVVDLETGELDVEATKNNITLNIVNLFVNVVFAKEQLSVAKSQTEVTSQQLQRTKKLVDAGALPLSDQLDLEAQNATSAMELTNAKNNLRLSKLNLMQAIQIPFEDEFDVSVPELEAENYMIANDNMEEVFSIAVTLMPEIKAAELGVESADYGVKIAKGSYYPTLGLGGSIGTNYINSLTDSLGEVVPFGKQFNGNISEGAGVSLSIPIFSNGRNKANLQRARVQKYLSEIREKEVRNQLRQDIETAYTNAVAAKQSYESSTIRVSSLDEAFRMAQKRFEVGVINAVDFQVAQNNLFNAQADLLQAKYEYIFSVKVLDFYLGNPLTL